MVLKDSKWDKKAKYKYLKKHGLVQPRTASSVIPKWSSKKQTESQRPSIAWATNDSDSEWDSEEDEALLEHFHPKIKEENLSVEQKKKVKSQLLADLSIQLQQKEPEPEKDGIYLGTLKDDSQEEPIDVGGLSFKEDPVLQDYLTSILGPSNRKKLGKSKMANNFLEEYGLDSYQQLIKEADFTSANTKKKPISKLSTEELLALKIGDQNAPTADTKNDPKLRTLTEDEKARDTERKEKALRAAYLNQIKSKFGGQPVALKVLELDTLDSDNPDHVAILNSKISRGVGDIAANTFEEDLDSLLSGDHEVKLTAAKQNTYFMPQAEKAKPKEKLDSAKKKLDTLKDPSVDNDFIDALLS